MGRLLVEQRDSLVTEWADWLVERGSTSSMVSRPVLEREFRLVVTALAEMVGPLRRECKVAWVHICEHYGRVAAMRGLAAGEVVEELQFLRDLLIRSLTPALWRGRPRQGMAVMLRLNRLLDKGVAIAVVGYTDVLVATLFAHNGVPAPHTSYDPAEVSRQLEALEQELAMIVLRR